MRQLIDDRISEFQTALERARDRYADSQFREALRELNSLPVSDHVIPETLIEESQKLKDEIHQQHSRLVQEAEQAENDAEQLHRSHQYKGVIQRLRPIPAAYLTPRSQQLAESASKYFEEVRRLRAEIAEDVEARRFLQLAPKVDRYLVLQPNEEKVRELARKVGELAAKRVREAIANSDYRKAHQFLEQVPQAGRSEEIQVLERQILEIHRLGFEVRNAALVDATLLSITERLRAVAPGIEDIAKAYEIMKGRLQRNPSDNRFPVIPWVAAPKRTTVGVPVDILGGFRRIRVADPALLRTVHNSPGAFFVACGLAIQGLGNAQLTNNVTLDKSDGFLSKISLFKTKRKSQSAWGIDLGGSSLKVAKLVVDPKTSEVLLAACDVIPFRLNLSHPEAELQRSEIVREALRIFVEKFAPTDDDALIANAPGAQTLVRAFNVPYAKESKVSEIIQHEVRNQIPFPLNEVRWSSSQFESNGSSPAKTSQAATLQRTVVIALRTPDLVTRIKDFEALNLRVPVFQADCVALHNFLAFDEFSAFSNEKEAVNLDPLRTIALLDVGAECCNLVFSSSQSVWFRIFRTGGNDINQTVIRDLKVTFAQAEELKLNPGKATRIDVVLHAIEPVLARVNHEVQRTLELFAKENPEKQLERLWLCGGGCSQFGLLRSMRSGSPTNFSS